MTKEIIDELFKLQDKKYGDFHSGLMPEIERDRIIGVRTPELRKLAKRICNEAYIDDFLNSLPHYYYEENNLHGELLILRYRDIDKLLDKLDEFLPYVDNWATCDMLSPKVFKKNLTRVYDRIEPWLSSEHTYKKRFAIVTLLGYYLDDAFEPKHLELVAGSNSDEYYIKMAVAWYFSFALIKQYEYTLPYLKEQRLDKWTHNKAIQKAVESRRVPGEIKDYLRTLKI